MQRIAGRAFVYGDRNLVTSAALQMIRCDHPQESGRWKGDSHSTDQGPLDRSHPVLSVVHVVGRGVLTRRERQPDKKYAAGRPAPGPHKGDVVRTGHRTTSLYSLRHRPSV